MQHIAYHDPVLCDETLNVLITDPNGIYVDGTLGGGGHASALLTHLSKSAKVFGIDQDDDALRAASKRINDNRFSTVKGNFGYMDVTFAVLTTRTCERYSPGYRRFKSPD